MPWLPTNSVAFEQFLTELLVFVHTAAEQVITGSCSARLLSRQLIMACVCMAVSLNILFLTHTDVYTPDAFDIDADERT